MTKDYPTPSDDDVVAALDHTGFMFEQRIARILGNDTVTGWAFEDPDSAESREIDLYVSRSTLTRMDGRDCVIGWTILGECKDYQNPWVAVLAEQHAGGEQGLHNEVFMSEPVRDKLGDTPDETVVGDLNPLDYLYSNARLWPVPCAVQILTLRKHDGRWETHGGDIYKTVTYPLAKALTTVARREREAAARSGFSRRLHVLFPVLVVSSPLRAVLLAADGSVEVRHVEHVTLERVIASETAHGRFRIDVLHASAVPRWRTEFIPRVIRKVVDRLDVTIDEGLVERLVRLDVLPAVDEGEAERVVLALGRGYGQVRAIAVARRTMHWIPLVHPGNRSGGWRRQHAQWRETVEASGW